MRYILIHQLSKQSASLQILYSGLAPTLYSATLITHAGLHTFSVSMMETGKGRFGGGGRGSRAPGADRRMTREAVILNEREKFVSMTLEEKRQVYKCGSNFSTLDNVETWNKLLKSDKFQGFRKAYESSSYRANNSLNDKVTIWKGDITKLEIDAIANAANNSLLGGGGVDGAIHIAAGSGLREECALLNGCDTGEAKITGGYRLPAKYVIHTVGPVGEKEAKLRSCYQNCLKLLKEYKLRSLAIPCISTGVYGYPNHPAAKIALETTRDWLDADRNSELVDRIVFCLFLPKDEAIYGRLMYDFFPPGADGEDSDPEGQGEDDQAEADKGATAATTTTVTATTATTATITAPDEDQPAKDGDVEEDTGRTGADGDRAEEDQTGNGVEPEGNEASGDKDNEDSGSMTREEIDKKVETADNER